MITRSATPMPSAPPLPPSPMTAATMGTGIRNQSMIACAIAAAMLRSRAGVGPGRVDQRDDRKSELGRVVREPQGFAVTLRVHHAPVPGHALLDAATLLVAEKHSRPSMPRADSADERRVVRREAVPVQLDEVGGEAPDVVERVGPLGMPGELDDLPDAHVYISRRWASSGRSSVRERTRSTCPCAS